MLIRKSPSQFLVFVLITFLALLVGPLGCSDDPVEPQDEDPEVSTPPNIHVDKGQVGLVIDTRAIFKKGYTPLTAEISCTDYPDLSATVDVDQTTHYAILGFAVADLPEATIDELADGISIGVTITGPSKSILTQYTDNSVVIDNSNTPLVLNTTLPFEPQPVTLETDMGYLIQVYSHTNLFSHGGFLSYFDLDMPYEIDNPEQLFYFTPVAGMESTFEFSSMHDGEMLQMCITNDETPNLILDHDHYLPALQVTLVPNEDGWVKFQDVATGEFLCLSGDDYQGHLGINLGSDSPMWFRLICDDIDWSVSDRGTTFNQPIMPPAQLDFAYRGELLNCAPGELTDSIGTTEERSWEVSSSTTEGFELFSSTVQTLGIEVGMSVSASIGADISGVVEASGEVELSTTVSYSETYTTSDTSSEEHTWSNASGGSKTVSHNRDYVVPAHTAVLIRDAVKTVRNVRVPFTQILRVSGTSDTDGRTLTGYEIRSQMLFNFVGGVIKTVGDDYVDIGLRGFTVIDQMFETSIYVNEIENACD